MWKARTAKVTVEQALKQIEDKKYKQQLLDRGIKKTLEIKFLSNGLNYFIKCTFF